MNVFVLLILVYFITVIFRSFFSKETNLLVLSLFIYSVIYGEGVILILLIPIFYLIKKWSKSISFSFLIFSILFIFKSKELNTILLLISGVDLFSTESHNFTFLTGLILINLTEKILNHNLRLKSFISKTLVINNILLPFKQKKLKQDFDMYTPLLFVITGCIFKILFSESFFYWSEYAFLGYSLNFFQVWISLICNTAHFTFEILAYGFISYGIILNLGYEIDSKDLLDKKKNFRIIILFCLIDKTGVITLCSILALLFYLVFRKFHKTKTKNVLLIFFLFITALCIRLENLDQFFKMFKELINVKSIFLYYNELYILWALKINWVTFLSLGLSILILCNIKKNFFELWLRKKIIKSLLIFLLLVSILCFDYSIDFRI